MSVFAIKFIAIPEDFSGYNGKFHNGMRIGIRWQKHIRESMFQRMDISFKIIDMDNNGVYRAICKSIITIPESWLIEGELIELLGSYNVVGVGKIEK